VGILSLDLLECHLESAATAGRTSVPTVLRIGPYRFFCYSSDGNEPVHIHVAREGMTAKFWLEPVRLDHTRGFGGKELNAVQQLVESHEQQLLRSWHEFFDN
jgi:hypothetical protein